MKLLSLEIETSFRSLPEHFKIDFQSTDCLDKLSAFRPFCMVGLNGCGKSNVLEAISHIFYHLELCVGVHIPQSLIGNESAFSRKKCVIDEYTLEYLHNEKQGKIFDINNIVKVRIEKKEGEEPRMSVSRNLDKDKFLPISLMPSVSNNQVAEGKRYLPEYIVAYSSGENETLNIPYIKSRILHLEEFKEATLNGYQDYDKPENGLVYIDANMSQAILLCCLLFEDDKTLSCLSNYDYTGILGVKRFRMALREHRLSYQDSKATYFRILKNDLFKKLELCSTLSWHNMKNDVYYYDFYVNDSMKRAFRDNFNSALDCFQYFRLLYELNYYTITTNKETEILGSHGIYTEGKYSLPGPEDDTFHFLDFYLTKQISKDGEKKDILLRSFSDGEHQFIHTMAICLLLKNSDALILLDEPETHFNPNWRSQFIHILNESLSNANNSTGYDADTSNFLKEVLITSHSPFIISDCQSDHVIILSKDDKGRTVSQTAKEKGIQTYGTSVGVLTSEIFDNDDSIGMRAYQEMKDISQNEPDKAKAVNEINSKFGESLEKLIVVSQLKQK